MSQERPHDEPIPGMFWEKPPQVRIARSGRISYWISIYDGPWTSGAWLALGSREHAEAKARRLLRRYLRRKALRSDVRTLTPEDL